MKVLYLGKYGVHQNRNCNKMLIFESDEMKWSKWYENGNGQETELIMNSESNRFLFIDQKTKNIWQWI